MTLKPCTCAWFSTDTANSSLFFGAFFYLLATVLFSFYFFARRSCPLALYQSQRSGGFMTQTEFSTQIILPLHHGRHPLLEPKWLPVLEFLSSVSTTAEAAQLEHTLEMSCAWTWENPRIALCWCFVKTTNTWELFFNLFCFHLANFIFFFSIMKPWFRPENTSFPSLP